MSAANAGYYEDSEVLFDYLRKLNERPVHVPSRASHKPFKKHFSKVLEPKKMACMRKPGLLKRYCRQPAQCQSKKCNFCQTDGHTEDYCFKKE